MSGRSIGFAVTTFAGVRVSGTLTYVPAHISATTGKDIGAKCTIPVMKNSNKGTDQRTGEPGRTDSYRLVAWGKLADSMARGCSPGKALDAVCEPRTYMGKYFDPTTRQPVLKADGQPLMVGKTDYVIIMSPIFGEESDKQVADEIMKGFRPQQWNNKQHTDYALWTSILQQRSKEVYDGTSETFVWARVVKPNGTIKLAGAVQPAQVNPAVMAAPVNPAVMTAPAPIAAQVAPVQPVQPGSIPSMVNYAVNNAPSPITPVTPNIQNAGAVVI